MKRQLIIMRHAKSSWTSGAATDHERPLNRRGRKTAPKVGEYFAKKDYLPQLVLSSDSRRTCETLERMAGSLDTATTIQFLSTLYHGATDDMRKALSKVPDETESVLILAHNPGCEYAVEWLTGRTDVVFKTADAAIMEGQSDSCQTWQSAVAEPASWRLIDFIRARDLS